MTQLLSSRLSLDAVAHQLGHTPGSSMTRSYAKFLASAQQKIAGRSQRVMDEMLKSRFQNNIRVRTKHLEKDN